MVETDQIPLGSQERNYGISTDTIFDSRFLIFRMVCIFGIDLEVDKIFG